MSDLNNLKIPEHYISFLNSSGLTVDWLNYSVDELPLFKGTKQLLLIIFGLCLAWLMPNTQEVFSKKHFTTNNTVLNWAPTIWWSSLLAGMTLFVLLSINKMSTFLYYQF